MQDVLTQLNDRRDTWSYSPGHDVHIEVLVDTKDAHAQIGYSQVRQEEIGDGTQTSRDSHHENHHQIACNTNTSLSTTNPHPNCAVMLQLPSPYNQVTLRR